MLPFFVLCFSNIPRYFATTGSEEEGFEAVGEDGCGTTVLTKINLSATGTGE